MNPEQRILFLESELHDREIEIALLKETAEAVSGELDLQKVLQLVARRARELILAETVLVPILDEGCAQYTYRAGCGKNADEIVGESLPLETGVCGWVWRNKRAWWRGVLDELDESERNKWEKEAGSILLVPLTGKSNFLGGLACINKIGGKDFTKRDLDLLTLFANQVSFAIDNATIFDQLNKAKEQLEEYQRQLQNLNAELEQRVAERTAELASAIKELERHALHDSLTGLPNRTLFHDRLRQALLGAKRANKSTTLIMVDMDRFREINDTHGRAVGDELLKEVGARLSGVLRQSDTVSRLGGDEFAVVLPSTDVIGAGRAAEKLLKILEAPFTHAGQTLSGTASMAIVVYPEHARDVTAMCQCADAAMRAAKRQQGGYIIYRPACDEPGAGRDPS